MTGWKDLVEVPPNGLVIDINGCAPEDLFAGGAGHVAFNLYWSPRGIGGGEGEASDQKTPAVTIYGRPDETPLGAGIADVIIWDMSGPNGTGEGGGVRTERMFKACLESVCESLHSDGVLELLVPNRMASVFPRRAEGAGPRWKGLTLWSYNRLLHEAGFRNLNVFNALISNGAVTHVVSMDAVASRAFFRQHLTRHDMARGLNGVRGMLYGLLLRANLLPHLEDAFLIIASR